MHSLCKKGIRWTVLFALALALVFGAAAPVQAQSTTTELEDLTETVFVDDDWVSSSPGDEVGEGKIFGTNAFATIQEGVAEVIDGGTVNVNAGTYTEQVVPNKNLKLIGAGIDQSTIKAPATLPAASQRNSAIVLIDGNYDVEISGFTISGPGPTSCGSILAGIGVYGGARANIHGNKIVDIRDAGDTIKGCQNGLGIFVGRKSWNTTGTAVIKDNEITGYQKGGIVVDNLDSSADITGNKITGVGTTQINAQNGVQISRGATATLSGNTITGNSYNKEDQWKWGATGVMVFDESEVEFSGGNKISGNDHNVDLFNTGLVTFGAEELGPPTAAAPEGYGFDVYNEDPDAIDLTSVTFVGTTNGFDIEKRVYHKIDNAAHGLATWVADNLYAYDSATLQAAIAAASDGDTVNVAQGTYELDKTTIEKNLTIAGDATTKPVIRPSGNFTGKNAPNAWILVNDEVHFTLRDVVIDGEDHNVDQAIRNHGNTTVSNVDFKNIKNAGSKYLGIAVSSFGGTVPSGGGSDSHKNGGPASTLSVTGSTFVDIGRIGVLVKGTESTATITDNTYTGKGPGNWLDYAFEVGAGGSVNINGNTVSGNWGIATSDGSTSAAILATDYYGTGTRATVTGNTFDDNLEAIAVGYGDEDLTIVTAHNNKILTTNNTGITAVDGTEVDATENWWGSVAGPAAGAIDGEVDYTPWCADEACTTYAPDNNDEIRLSADVTTDEVQAAIKNAPEGTTIYIPEGDYSLDGGFEIDTPDLTIILADGTVIQNNSPCFTVSASNTQIVAETGGVVKCVPTDDDHGIIVNAGVTGVTIAGIEFVGTDGTDGIHFEGTVTDVVIANNFFHDLQDDGIEFTVQPEGIVQIQGNLFKNNGGLGINNVNGTEAIPAKYNAWGSFDGPQGEKGDGVSENVDFEPWTHVDLYVKSVSILSGDQVFTGETITYEVYGNFVNVMGADFTLDYPDNLTFISSSVEGSGFEVPKVTEGEGKLVFSGWNIESGAVTGQDVKLFSATFTAGAPGTTGDVILDDATDAFSMAPTSGPSNIIYADELTGAKASVIDRPGLESTTLEGPYLVGVQQEFSVKTTNPTTGGTFNNVRVKAFVEGATLGDITSFEYYAYDPNTGTALGWKEWDLREVDGGLEGYYGPAVGFPLMNGAESQFRVTFAEAKTYPVTLTLVDMQSTPAETPLAVLEKTAQVYTQPTLSSTDIQGPYMTGVEQEFHVTLTNPDGTFIPVRFNFVITGAELSDIDSFTYLEDDGKYYNMLLSEDGNGNLVGYYGDIDGFPMIPGTYISTFKIKFNSPKTYPFLLTLDELNDSTVLTELARLTEVATVKTTVTGTFSMQGRLERAGIPVTLDGAEDYTEVTTDKLSGNLVISVVSGAYTITTNQPRYLNVTAELGKTIDVTTATVLPALELKGGNAVWTDNVINLQDANRVSTVYGKTLPDDDGDVNFDGKVDIFDLAMVGGNYDETSSKVYADWEP